MYALHVLLVCLTSNVLAQATIEGFAELDPAQATHVNTIRIAVYSRSGERIESALVTPDGNFKLHLLPQQSDGVYILYLIGSMTDEYAPMLLNLQAGTVKSVLSRRNPLLIPPKPDEEWPENDKIRFVSSAKALYVQKGNSWSWRYLWAYKFRLLQLAGVAFVVWFPKVIRDLPKELREELMGEKEPELGDTNAHFKALLGREDKEMPAASSSRQ